MRLLAAALAALAVVALCAAVAPSAVRGQTQRVVTVGGAGGFATIADAFANVTAAAGAGDALVIRLATAGPHAVDAAATPLELDWAAVSPPVALASLTIETPSGNPPAQIALTGGRLLHANFAPVGFWVVLRNVGVSGGSAVSGGVVLLLAGKDGSGVELDGASLSGNSASVQGGAVYVSGDVASNAVVGLRVLGGSSLSGNSAGDAGGALFGRRADINVTCPVAFSNNVASGQGGGAVALDLNTRLFLTQGSCSFVGNQAAGMGSDGGAILGLGPSGSISIDAGTSAGRFAFTANNATGQGGAVFADRTTLTAGRCDFADNAAVGGGGAVTLSSGAGNAMTDCTFTDNSCSARGGAMLLEGGSVATDDCAFTNNAATNSGGALACLGGSASFSGATVTGNQANRGGAFSAEDGGSLTVEGGTSVTGNSASDGGAAYIHQRSSILITGASTRVTGNDASRNGGGIFCSASTVEVADGATIEANTAENDSGDALNEDVHCATIVPNTQCTITGDSVHTDRCALADEGPQPLAGTLIAVIVVSVLVAVCLAGVVIYIVVNKPPLVWGLLSQDSGDDDHEYVPSESDEPIDSSESMSSGGSDS